LKDIIESVRSAGETPYLSPDKLPPNEVVDSLYQEMDNALGTSLATLTLRDLSLAEPGKVLPMSDAANK
jgi:hypothetical protein